MKHCHCPTCSDKLGMTIKNNKKQRREKMKKLAILSPLVLLATAALAQDSTCILQPSCSQLGYTSAEADCGTQKVLRCPFDVSQVACVGGSGSGGSDGDGGSVETDEFGTVDNSSCQVGYYYYSDDTCSPEYNYFKDVIGIVFDAKRRYIVSKDKVGNTWGNTIPSSLPLISDELSLIRDFNGKEYTSLIVAANTSSAAAECLNLTYGNKEWFLPSAGQAYLLHYNWNVISTKCTQMNKFASCTVSNYMFTSNVYNTNYVYHYNSSNNIFEKKTNNLIYTVGYTNCIAEY